MESISKEGAISIIQTYYPQVKVVDYHNKKCHNMTLQLTGSFIVEGSNFKTLAFNPGAKSVLIEITDEKLRELESQMR